MYIIALPVKDQTIPINIALFGTARTLPKTGLSRGKTGLSASPVLVPKVVTFGTKTGHYFGTETRLSEKGEKRDNIFLYGKENKGL